MNTANLDAPGFAAVAGIVRARAGFAFPPSRHGDLVAVTHRVMARCGLSSLPDLLERLDVDTSLLDGLIADLTVGETYFFRDPGHFDLIRNDIVPELRRLRGAEHVLRVWSAGCASGEEAYSLAILFEESGLAGSVRILATDISRPALARAQDATYGAWSLRGDGARIVGPHLHRVGNRFRLAGRHRRRVDFACLNLAQNVYPTFASNTWGVDLVLCRNVLIYFDAETVRAVARRLYDALADGAYLIVGPSDPPLAEHAPFEILTTPSGVVYRKPRTPARAIASPPIAATAYASGAAAPALAGGQHARSSPVLHPAARWRAVARPAGTPIGGPRRTRAADTVERALQVRALANHGDTEAALAMAAEAAASYPAAPEIAFLHAVLLMNLGRHAEAEHVLRRLLYLDRSLAVVHFALGTTLHRMGDRAGAARAWRTAGDLAARRPPGEIVLLSDGESAGRLASAAAAQAALAEASQEVVR